MVFRFHETLDNNMHTMEIWYLFQLCSIGMFEIIPDDDIYVYAHMCVYLCVCLTWNSRQKHVCFTNDGQYCVEL